MSLSDVRRVLEAYASHFEDRLEEIHTQGDSRQLFIGIPTLDRIFTLRPGITIIYSPPDGGKTSLAKTLARSATVQGLNVAYYDAEHKIPYEDLLCMTGVTISTSYTESGLKSIVTSGILDMLVVDTITSVPDIAQHAFVNKIRRRVPYLILVSQMRTDIKANALVPAVDKRVQASSSIELYITSREKIHLEGLDMNRVQCSLVKYAPDRSREKIRESFVIYRNLVDPLATLYDRARSEGYIRTFGRDKSLGEFSFGSLKSLAGSEIEPIFWDGISKLYPDIAPKEVYCWQTMIARMKAAPSSPRESAALSSPI